MPPVTFRKYSLTMGENTFQSVASTSPDDARKLQSLISSLAGDLEREHQLISLSASPFPSKVGWIWQFNVNLSGADKFFLFAATATTLYLLNPLTKVWSPVAAVGTLAGFPVARNINGLMHLSDFGNNRNWIFDGLSWMKEGLEIPTGPPQFVGSASNRPSTQIIYSIGSIKRVNGVITVQTAGGLAFTPTATLWVNLTGTTDSSFIGTVLLTGVTSTTATGAQTGPDSPATAGGTMTVLTPTILTNRYYWTTFVDQSATHGHESSSSPISLGSGPQSGAGLGVKQRSGGVALVAGSTAVIGTGTDFSQSDVGRTLWSTAGTQVIAEWTDSQHITLATAPGISAASFFAIAPARATAWNLYASSSEEDKNGNLLATIPLDTSGNNFEYIDQSPMIGTVGSYFSFVGRPLLNDPPNPTTRMDAHKNRLWRRDETRQNFFGYTGYEEILAEQAGSPYECQPGAAGDATVSTQENETSLPDQSLHIRGFCSHGDSLYIGSEKNVYPLYGASLQDFGLSQVEVFAVGFAGRSGLCTTPFGLAFLSYDTKVYLYPSQYEFQVESTTALIELGRPKRPEFETILGSDFDQVQMLWYNWGRRNWLVFTYQKNDATYATWVFDFETKGWFQLQQGYTAIAVYEVTPGKKALVAAALDNNIYVIDDLTGSFTPSDGATFPLGIYRQVVDFGAPNSFFIIGDVEYESDDPDMEIDVTLYIDPADPDNPVDGIPIAMTRKTIGAGGSKGGTQLASRFGGRPNASTGATCQRVLVEFAVPASTVNGKFRGFTIEAAQIEDPVL